MLESIMASLIANIIWDEIKVENLDKKLDSIQETIIDKNNTDPKKTPPHVCSQVSESRIEENIKILSDKECCINEIKENGPTR